MIKPLVVMLSLLPVAGCTGFAFCQKLITGIEQTTDPIVYDYWNAQVEYKQDWGGYKFDCRVNVSASGYIGQRANLTHRPDYIDGVLK